MVANVRIEMREEMSRIRKACTDCNGRNKCRWSNVECCAMQAMAIGFLASCCSLGDKTELDGLLVFPSGLINLVDGIWPKFLTHLEQRAIAYGGWVMSE